MDTALARRAFKRLVSRICCIRVRRIPRTIVEDFHVRGKDRRPTIKRIGGNVCLFHLPFHRDAVARLTEDVVVRTILNKHREPGFLVPFYGQYIVAVSILLGNVVKVTRVIAVIEFDYFDLGFRVGRGGLSGSERRNDGLAVNERARGAGGSRERGVGVDALGSAPGSRHG